jgi:hypothetical protein
MTTKFGESYPTKIESPKEQAKGIPKSTTRFGAVIAVLLATTSISCERPKEDNYTHEKHPEWWLQTDEADTEYELRPLEQEIQWESELRQARTK